MNNNYELVIGLEVHLQPTTRSKMFCPCGADYFGKEPNTHVCPVCLGLPGALPVPNKLAIEKCIKLGLALNSKINKQSRFDRKHYFYPDSSKGYQISQYDLPFCYGGYVEIDSDKDAKRIRITRIHLEEDTAKSIHTDTQTLIDFNKAGVPLIELVTEPDFRDVKEVLIFAKRLRQIARYLEIGTADMEKGQLRFELNMSLKKSGEKSLPSYKIEVKNISSITVLEKVINFEFERQSKILDSGTVPVQETRGIRDLSGKTYSQRKKEDAQDYRYFPEPDIPPINISDEQIQLISSKIVELPQQRKFRYIGKYNLDPSTAETLISKKALSDWFENSIKDEENIDTVRLFAMWLTRDLLSMMKLDKTSIKDLKFSGSDLILLVNKITSNELSGNMARQVLEELYKKGGKVEEVVKNMGLTIITDESELLSIIEKVLSENAKVVQDIDKNPNAIKFLLGQVMKHTKGQADPGKAMEVLSKRLQ